MATSGKSRVNERMDDVTARERSPESIGERLELTRSVFGLAQGEFADRAGLAANTYNQFERGKKRPQIESANALCDAYGLTLDWIYRGDPSGLRYELAAQIKQRRAQP